MSLEKQEAWSSQWSTFILLISLFLHYLLQWSKMSKAAIHSVKAPGKENIINLYFRVSVIIGNITHLRLCVILRSLWKSLLERCWKVFYCVFIHLYTCVRGYLAPRIIKGLHVAVC